MARSTLPTIPAGITQVGLGRKESLVRTFQRAFGCNNRQCHPAWLSLPMPVISDHMNWQWPASNGSAGSQRNFAASSWWDEDYNHHAPSSWWNASWWDHDTRSWWDDDNSIDRARLILSKYFCTSQKGQRSKTWILSLRPLYLIASKPCVSYYRTPIYLAVWGPYWDRLRVSLIDIKIWRISQSCRAYILFRFQEAEWQGGATNTDILSTSICLQQN